MEKKCNHILVAEICHQNDRSKFSDTDAIGEDEYNLKVVDKTPKHKS